ncbi:unnamed protein product [Durusdinium trenchii]|uniref:Uncharacterized protein n=1 Tax=Durusdinium trenchii TaxID=1381693 RepID=A0ABP0NRZ9_9DINO
MVHEGNQRVVWIASSPDTVFRVPDTFVDTGTVFQTRRCNLNVAASTSGIKSECEQRGLDWKTELPDHILTAALVEPHFAYDSLRLLTHEEALQLDMYRRLFPAKESMHGVLTFFNIKAQVQLQEPMPVQRVGVRKNRTFFQTLQEGQLDRLLELLSDFSQTPIPEWLTDALRNNLAEGMVQLPGLVARLCASGAWTTFAVCDLKSSLFKGWSVGSLWVPDQLPITRFPPPPRIENIVEADIASKYARHLQELFNGMDQEMQRDMPAGMTQDLHVLTASLQQHVSGMQVAYGHDEAVIQAGQDSYNVFYLLHCFVLCDLLKSDKSLEEAVQHACRIALPKHIQDVVLNMLRNKKRPVPSPSTVSRLRLKLDVGWMMMTRNTIDKMLNVEGGVVVNCMVDSSPQGGHDYELLQVSIVRKRDLAQLHVDILALERMSNLSLEERVQNLQEEKVIMNRICSCCHVFTPPPVLLGLGKGRSTLALKFHAAMHALYLMAGPSENLEKFTSSVCTWVSDYGTEAGFAHVRRMPLRALFPYILESEQRGDTYQQDEVDFSVAVPGSPKKEPHIDCEHSISVPGLLHILHNAFLGLGGAMVHFQETINRLKEVAALLDRPETKERLLATCYKGMLGEALASEIKAFSGHVYEERWGTVSHCALQLNRCESSLRHMWDLDKYSGTSSACVRGESSNLVVVDDAIGSDFFWAYITMLCKFAKLQTQLMSWAEGCPCHWEVMQSEGIPVELRRLWESCPMRGKRAAELASGKFHSMLQEFLDKHVQCCFALFPHKALFLLMSPLLSMSCPAFHACCKALPDDFSQPHPQHETNRQP